MPSTRSALRSALTNELLPALRELGYVGPKAISGNALLHEFKRAANSGTQVLTVQLERHGLPRFIVNLATEPPEGFAAIIQRGGSVRQGRVQPARGPSTRAWFRAD